MTRHLSEVLGRTYDTGWMAGREAALGLPVSQEHLEAIALRSQAEHDFKQDLQAVRMVLRSLRHCLNRGLRPSPELRADLSTISRYLSGDDDQMGYLHEQIHLD